MYVPSAVEGEQLDRDVYHKEILLVLDLRKAQKTDHIKQLLRECRYDTTPFFVPTFSMFPF